MEHLYSLMGSGGSGLPGILLLSLVLLGVFRPERVANWQIYRIAWIVIIMSTLLPSIFMFASTAGALDGGRTGRRSEYLIFIQPVMNAVGAFLVLYALKTRPATEQA